jgi:hypothetical protein
MKAKERRHQELLRQISNTQGYFDRNSDPIGEFFFGPDPWWHKLLAAIGIGLIGLIGLVLFLAMLAH